MVSTRYIQPTEDNPLTITNGDVRDIIRTIPSDSVQCVVTSPPYWGVRDYGVQEQIGAEPDIKDYVAGLVSLFSEVRRILTPDGTFWLNIGNTYTSGGRKWRQEDGKNKGRAMSYRPDTPDGLKKKDLIGVAWMVAMGCQLDGWYLRNDIIWHKPNCQPESVKDRLTVSHEYLFLLTKSERYHFDQTAIMEDTKDGGGKKNRRTVWPINTEAFAGAHFATFPTALVRPCILAGSKPGDIVLDPFLGSGTVCLEALRLGRLGTGIELNPDYVRIAERRLRVVQPSLVEAWHGRFEPPLGVQDAQVAPERLDLKLPLRAAIEVQLEHQVPLAIVDMAIPGLGKLPAVHPHLQRSAGASSQHPFGDLKQFVLPRRRFLKAAQDQYPAGSLRCSRKASLNPLNWLGSSVQSPRPSSMYLLIHTVSGLMERSACVFRLILALPMVTSYPLLPRGAKPASTPTILAVLTNACSNLSLVNASFENAWWTINPSPNDRSQSSVRRVSL